MDLSSYLDQLSKKTKERKNQEYWEMRALDARRWVFFLNFSNVTY